MSQDDLAVPLYRRIAAALQAAILGGEYPPGGIMPTELELAEQFGVSRHTVRDGLRILASAGIVSRHRRVGTVVGEEPVPAPAFTQPLHGYDELLQYARAARLLIDFYGPATRSGMVRRLGLDPANWIRIEGRRVAARRPVGLTTIAVRRDCAPSRDLIERGAAAMFDLVERTTGIETKRIEQEIAATALGRRAADALLVEVGSPALRTVRRYHDQRDRLFLVSETLHPGGRFTYSMTYTRHAAAQRLAA